MNELLVRLDPVEFPQARVMSVARKLQNVLNVLNVLTAAARTRLRYPAAAFARSSEQNLSLRQLEREYIFEMLRRTGENKKRAAEMLGLDRKTLCRKLEECYADGYWLAL
jgi:DNA-binding NtrC family response regulator